MYSKKVRIHMSQVDKNGLLKPASLVDIMQNASLEWYDSFPAYTHYLKKHKIALMVGSRYVEILRYPRYDERLDVRTSVYEFKTRYGCRNTALYDKDGLCVARSWAVGLNVNLQTGKLSSVPQDICKSIELEKPLDMNYHKKKICPPANVEPQTAPAYHPPRASIDLNGHVNNAAYLSLAFEHIPEEFLAKSLYIEYRTQCLRSDTIYPHIYKVENGDYIVNLAQKNKHPYAILELCSAIDKTQVDEKSARQQ